VDKADEIVWCDFAAGSEAAGKWIVASFDNIIIPLEPNSKNLDVAKDIYKTLKLIHFENVYFIANKISKPEDIDYINNYFGEKLNYVWIIPFSKEIMKSDITGNLSFEWLNEDLKNIFQNIANTILKFPSNRWEVLERLQKLDILKWDKKCH
jgi:CO dehydrogenase nickel-insertion accessory protein CooC1